MSYEFTYRIGGVWEPGAAAGENQDLNPADQREVLARFQLMDEQQTRRAMDAAAAGAALWKAATPIARAAVLSRAARTLRAQQDDIAQIVSSENGKTLAEARVEVEKSADFLDFYAASARLPQGGIIADGRPGTRAMALIEPVGIVAMITPWNDPFLTPARKLGPALISGNAVLLKPARETPLAAYQLTRALVDAGLPDGVLNLVMCEHATFDKHVLADPRLAAVTFTGSTEVGLGLSRKLAGRNLRLQTEMGGKNASVVLADADLDLAVATIVGAAFGQAGQRCTATSRVIVEDPVHDAFVARLCDAVGRLRTGAGSEASTNVGPVVNRRQQAEVLSHIEGARKSGASLLQGGAPPPGADYVNGCYVAPTVLAGVTRDMPIWRDEVFGPVLAITRVASFDEAVAAVNDSVYGLSAALFTNSLRYAQRFLDAADTGQVSVNLPTSGWDVHQPFGGFKLSGSAFKEQGLEGLHFYTRVKMTAVRFDW
ncbi:MAG: putative NAD+-dependent betaine aldehyde dehydrogenase [Hydrocarboniphaga sp.]|uniref:aldehyde dehydrogenase family protein n=1 Tax=Hydrocarboniphaga sp. TaxID=2033016 RepID=UPI002629B3A1|nr:aldehyde dehydrogenase family protein [Hydrocarboniphaga sp.]MDB5972445.1 putative NAD+-dependent betaine aldehyde dehydrogenase [Hydrocarboniphaga sp.]